MKTTLRIAVALAAIFYVPLLMAASQAQTIVEKVYKVDSFNSIETNGVFNVYLTQGAEEMVKVFAPQDKIDEVKVEKNGDRLKLSNSKSFFKKNSSKINIYITFKELKSLSLNGVGNVETTAEIKTEKLSVDGSSVGNISITLNCKELTTNLSSVGNVTLKGSAQKVSIDHSGTGQLSAFDLKAETLSLDCSGVGGIEVYASKEISIDCSGVGSVSYKGNAVVKALSRSGVGSINKVE